VTVLVLGKLVLFVDLADEPIVSDLSIHREVREVCHDAEVSVTIVRVPHIRSQMEYRRPERDVSERHELVLVRLN